MDVHSRPPKVGVVSPYNGPPITLKPENKSLKKKIMNLFGLAKKDMRAQKIENQAPIHSVHSVRQQKGGSGGVSDVADRTLFGETAFLNEKKTIEYKDFEKIIDYVNSNRDTLFLSSGYHRREKTRLPNAIQIQTPKTGSDDEVLVIVQLKPSKFQKDRRNVISLNQGSEKLVKLSMCIDVKNQKARYVATATPKAASRRMGYGQGSEKLLDARIKFNREIAMLERFKGQRGIVQIKAHSVYPIKGDERLKTNIVLEYADADFFDLMQDVLENIRIEPEYREQWTQGSQRIDYEKQLLEGLANVHREGIAHCDIKLDNLLLCENEAKIGDFGFAVDAKKVGDELQGTPLYLSPEILNYIYYRNEVNSRPEGSFLRIEYKGLRELYKKSINEKTDVYSLGICLYFMKYLKLPDYLTIGNRVKEPDEILNPDKLDELLAEQQIWYSFFQPQDDEGKLIKEMMNPNPDLRISSQKALESMKRFT
jgi:serine/threonine protein kinase